MFLILIIVLDSSSKIPSGLLMGNYIDYGMIDECLDVKNTVIDSNNRSREIRGQQCMYSAKFKMNKKTFPGGLKLSICVPSSCEAKDVQKLLQSLVKNIERYLAITSYKLKIAIDSTDCTPIDDDFWDSGFIIAL